MLDGTERLIRFEWAKSRFGASPPYVYLKRNHTGFFDIVTSPTAKRNDDNDRMIQMLRDAWVDGLRLEQVQGEFSLPNTDKARRLILRVGGVAKGTTRDRKYYHPDCLDELEPELPGMGS